MKRTAEMFLYALFAMVITAPSGAARADDTVQAKPNKTEEPKKATSVGNPPTPNQVGAEKTDDKATPKGPADGTPKKAVVTPKPGANGTPNKQAVPVKTGSGATPAVPRAAPFVDRDGDGIHDGKEHRFRRQARSRDRDGGRNFRRRAHSGEQKGKGGNGPAN